MIYRRLLNLGSVLIAPVILASFCDVGEARPRFSPAEDRQIADCIREAAAGRPWLEKTLWGLRDQEGGWLGAAVLNTNGSHDLGPLQVNTWWVPRLARLIGRPEEQVRHWLRHDACFNAEAARWIFLSGLVATRDYWRAVGVYHSPTDWRQRRYALSVAGKLKIRFGDRLFTQRDMSGAEVGAPPSRSALRSENPRSSAAVADGPNQARP